MSDTSAILPETAFAKLADTLLLAINQDAIIAELSEGFVAGIKNDDSRRTMTLALEKSRESTARMAELYKLIVALGPYEDVVRVLIEQLHRQSQRGNSAAA